MNILCMTPIEHLDGALNLINQFGEVTYVPNILKNEVNAKLIENKITHIFTNPNKQNFILNAELLSNTSVQVINTCSTGLNHIDEQYCSDNNIDIWSLTKDYELINDLPSTSELAFGLMMSLLRFIPTSFHSVKDGNWDYEPYVGHQVKGKTVGIVGYGRLGKIMKRLFDGWGVNILVTDPYARITNAKGVSLDELLEKSDIVFLHTHVTDETRDMVDDEFIQKMKDGSFLINTARGELVKEDSIITALEQRKLKGYATDVIRDEFGGHKQSKLVDYSINPNSGVIITPHIGGMTIEGQTKAYHYAINKFRGVNHD